MQHGVRFLPSFLGGSYIIPRNRNIAFSCLGLYDGCLDANKTPQETPKSSQEVAASLLDA